jgi:hypothetical protein
MKNILLFTLLLFIHRVSAQNILDEKLFKSQKDDFEKAEKALENSDELEALNFHHFVYSINLNTDLESISKKRIDSLLPLIQKKEIKKWKGKWKIKQLRTNKFNYEYIEITENKILFYDKNNLVIPSRIEEIRFAKYNPRDIFISISRVIFKNNEVWEFNTEKVNRELRLFPNLKTDANGKGYHLLDDRSIIKDPVKRKEALAEEIRTYYILEKK